MSSGGRHTGGADRVRAGDKKERPPSLSSGVGDGKGDDEDKDGTAPPCPPCSCSSANSDRAKARISAGVLGALCGERAVRCLL